MSTRTLTEQELKARSDYLRAEEFDVPDEPPRIHRVPTKVGVEYSGRALCGRIVNGTAVAPGKIPGTRCLACEQVYWERTR